MHFIWTIIIGFIAGVIAKFGGSGLCGIPPHGTAVKPTNLSGDGKLIPRRPAAATGSAAVLMQNIRRGG